MKKLSPILASARFMSEIKNRRLKLNFNFSNFTRNYTNNTLTNSKSYWLLAIVAKPYTYNIRESCALDNSSILAL